MASQATQADSPKSGVVAEMILDVSCSVQWQAYVLIKHWTKRTQQRHAQFRNVPTGKVESKFLKLRKQLKRKQEETLSSVTMWDYNATSRL